MGVIDRGAEYKAVRFPCLFDENVDDVAVQGAPARRLFAGAAGNAVPHCRAAQMEDLRLHTLTLQGVGRCAQGREGAALGMGAAIDKQNVHEHRSFFQFPEREMASS